MNDIIQASINHFQHDLEHLEINIVEEKKGLFGIGAHMVAEVSLKNDPVKSGLEYLQQLMKDLGIEASIDIITDENFLTYNIKSDNNGFLIGKNGKALQSLQTLVNQVVGRQSKVSMKVKVDVDSYRLKQIQRLENLANKVAQEVVKTKIAAKLDPMNAFERRTIHQTLSSWDNIQTVSEGVEPNRYLIIKSR